MGETTKKDVVEAFEEMLDRNNAPLVERIYQLEKRSAGEIEASARLTNIVLSVHARVEKLQVQVSDELAQYRTEIVNLRQQLQVERQLHPQAPPTPKPSVLGGLATEVAGRCTGEMPCDKAPIAAEACPYCSCLYALRKLQGRAVQVATVIRNEHSGDEYAAVDDAIEEIIKLGKAG